MAVLSIVKYGNPVLREKGEEIKEINEDIRQLVSDMCETMKAAPGLGLTAHQIGRSLALFVIDMSYFDENAGCKVFINPKIIKSEGISSQEEGCLSIPGINDDIERYEYVKLSALDLDGKEFEFEGEGLLARALMHEYDHTQGILIIDRISALKRKLLTSKLKKISKEGHI